MRDYTYLQVGAPDHDPRPMMRRLREHDAQIETLRGQIEEVTRPSVPMLVVPGTAGKARIGMLGWIRLASEGALWAVVMWILWHFGII